MSTGKGIGVRAEKANFGCPHAVGPSFAALDAAEAAAIRREAEVGNAAAQYIMAGVLARGDGARRDIRQALEWVRLSAQQGYAPALRAWQVVSTAIEEFFLRPPSSRESAAKFPRVSLDTPVEVRTPNSTLMARSADVSIGGLLIRTPHLFAPGTQLVVRFNLPEGHSITSKAKVVHTTGESAMGLEFVQLQPEDRDILADFTFKMLQYVRRGGRLAQRYYLLVRGTTTDSQQEVAETVLVSRHGGLLVCRAAFKFGEHIFLWWPEKNRGAEAKIVFRQLKGPDGLTELGFEFHDTDNFWELEFPA